MGRNVSAKAFFVQNFEFFDKEESISGRWWDNEFHFEGTKMKIKGRE